MSAYYSADIIYGVPVTITDICDFRDHNWAEWEKIRDKWVFDPNVYLNYRGGSDKFVIGIGITHVKEGGFEELGYLNEPSDEDINALCKILERFGIKRKPTWLLMCQIS